MASPLAKVPTAGPRDLLVEVLDRMRASADGRMLVLDGDRLVGIVSLADVARVLD